MEESYSRILSFDLARGIAIIGMVFVNYEVLIKGREKGPDLLLTVLHAIEGRAAALFLVLAGIGISLMTRDLRQSEPATTTTFYRFKLVTRAVFLLAVGLMNFYFWFPDILHFYAVYFVIAALLFTLNGWLLLLISVITVLTGLYWFLSSQLNHFTNVVLVANQDIWTLSGMLYHLFFAGYYPVFPVFALVLLGIWFGRWDIHDSKFRHFAVIIAILAFILVEIFQILLEPVLERISPLSDTDVFFLLRTKPLPPVPLYILSAASTSVIIIIISYYLVAWIPENKILISIIRSGQLALTMYLFHMIPLLLFVRLFTGYPSTLTTVFISGFLFNIFMLCFSYYWRKWYNRGPVEWIMRKITL